MDNHLNITKKWFKIFLLLAIFCILVLIFYGFSEKLKKPEGLHLVSAKLQNSNTNLYYSGVVKPLEIISVASPVDGVVKKVHFHYGAAVMADQLLVELDSTKVKQDYTTALTNYIKDKDIYLKSKRSFESTAALYQLEIVDRETYLNEKSQFQINQLAYINSQNNLQEISKNLPVPQIDIESLELKNIEMIKQILAAVPKEFKVYSPKSGILLSLQKSEDDRLADETVKELGEGSETKRHQTLIRLGDMTGIATTVFVNEMDINEIYVGQTAALTNPALPGVIFYGKVTEVARQAKVGGSGGGGAVSFPVQITVPKITEIQRRLIRVGMTLKVNITLPHSPQIQVPIKAVFERDGQNFVDVWDAKIKKAHTVPVKTGMTGMSSVNILEGVKAGDQIVVHDGAG